MDSVNIKKVTRNKPPKGAFTLIELLVVIAIIAILAAILLPALAASKARAVALNCMNNNKQLSMAWFIYSQEFNDNLVPSTDVYTGGVTPNWCVGIETWDTSKINTNINALVQDNLCLLAPYSAHQYQIYHCPADVFVSLAQAKVGWDHRVRSVSMSCALGAGTRAPEFPWAVKIQKTTMTQLRNPGPSDVWVFLDEAPDSINDAMFYNNPDSKGAIDGTANGGNWIDSPASLHNGSGSLGFADGHAEIHKWMDANTRSTSPPAFTTGVSSSYKHAPNDVGWLGDRTPVP